MLKGIQSGVIACDDHMCKMGLMAVYQRPKTSQPHPQHKTYPYRLRGKAIIRPSRVYCADITYIPMRCGFLYLVAIMNWHSRALLSWSVLNTLDADFCVVAEETMNHCGVAESSIRIKALSLRATSLRRRSRRPEHASQWMGEAAGWIT